MLWIWLVLLYGVLKGCREICKKKALLTCSSVEVLLIYSFVSFLLVCPDAPHAMGLAPGFYFYIALKSFVIFVAWICGFQALKHLPVSFYGVLDLSRVLFATLLGVVVLHEVMSPFNILGLILVGTGLVMLKFQPSTPAFHAGQTSLTLQSAPTGQATPDGQTTHAEQATHAGQLSPTDQATAPCPVNEPLSRKLVLLALASCLLNAVSGLMDKILMQQMNSSQLQFWYMLFLCLFYGIYALLAHTRVNLRRALTNRWIWLLSVLFVIADRALFVANSMEASQVTIMTLLKQAGCIVTILAGKFIFKEENTGHKFLCAAIIIAGIVLGVM